MKRVTQLNYYELFDLDPNATKAEIQRSYCRLKKTYQSNSLAIYSIVSSGEREYMESRIDEAYKILMDDILRREYDQSIGIDTRTLREETVKPIFSQNRVQGSGNDERDFFVERDLTEDIDRGEMVKGVDETVQLDPMSRSFLKSFREKKGIPLREIAESTNISMHMLSCLEEGDYNKLPGRAYAVGFLREYARYLGMDFQQAKQNMEKWSHW